jgi:hypothetical protein
VRQPPEGVGAKDAGSCGWRRAGEPARGEDRSGCDDSPNRHATAHARGTSHPIIRSLERGEDWSWCYVDEVAMLIPDVKGTTRIPASPLGG